jgi:hypothetical protein
MRTVRPKRGFAINTFEIPPPRARGIIRNKVPEVYVIGDLPLAINTHPPPRHGWLSCKSHPICFRSMDPKSAASPPAQSHAIRGRSGERDDWLEEFQDSDQAGPSPIIVEQLCEQSLAFCRNYVTRSVVSLLL